VKGIRSIDMTLILNRIEVGRIAAKCFGRPMLQPNFASTKRRRSSTRIQMKIPNLPSKGRSVAREHEARQRSTDDKLSDLSWKEAKRAKKK